MQIICKFKDFYDYKCYAHGRDPFPAFDRRGAIKLTQSDLTKWIIGLKHHEGYFICNNSFWCDKGNEIFYLEAGSDKYIFAACNATRKKTALQSPDFEYNCDIQLLRKIKSSNKINKAVIALCRLHIDFPGKLKLLSQNRHYCSEKIIQRGNYIKTCSEKKFTYGKRYGIELPILSETKLTGLLDPQEIYISLDSYLRSLHNDVSQESSGLTDEAKAVNKGFNKRESFRNIHPRS